MIARIISGSNAKCITSPLKDYNSTYCRRLLDLRPQYLRDRKSFGLEYRFTHDLILSLTKQLRFTQLGKTHIEIPVYWGGAEFSTRIRGEADFARNCNKQHKEDDTIQGARIANLNRSLQGKQKVDG